MANDSKLSKMAGVYILGQATFQAVTLGDDLPTSVKGLKKRQLVALAHFVKTQGHQKYVVGLVRSVVELEMASRWFAEKSGF